MPDGSNPVVDAARWLRDATRDLRPGPPVAVTYHPLTYAWDAHQAYLDRYANGRRKVVMVGMNPGPWGMAQTGVPFGDVEIVRDWLGLKDIPIGQPDPAHPKRPVQGWDCTRGEGSGRRLWGFLRDTYGTPERALADLAIANHCPMLFFAEEGTNLTPDKLRKADRDAITAVCDEGLRRAIDALEPETLIGVGNYAEARCEAVAESAGLDVDIQRILHPSPASPLANKDGGRHWRDNVTQVFEAAGLL